MARKPKGGAKRKRTAVPPPPPLECIVMTKLEACGFLRMRPRQFDELRRKDKRFPLGRLVGRVVGRGEDRGSAMPRWKRADLLAYLEGCETGWASTGGFREGAFGSE